jgi:non-heme chloroperoxidase
MQQSTTATSLVINSAQLRNGLILQYVEQGDASGLPVVFLHGVTDSWLSFERVLSHLPSSMRVFAVSQRGHGESSRPDASYRFADFSNDLDQFLDAVSIPAAVIVGHSMGSYVAQRFAIDHADRTIGLVLMGAFAKLRGNPVVQELWDLAVSKLADPVDPAFAREFQESTLARPIDPAYLEAFVQESLRLPARVWRATFAEFLEADFSNELTRITAPTLILWGDRDVIFPRNDQDVLLRSVAGSRLVIYPGAGHAFHWEDPARFASDLVMFAAERQWLPSASSVRGAATSTIRSVGVAPANTRTT